MNDYNETVVSSTSKDLLLKEEAERAKIERRIQRDATNIQKVCAKYLGSVTPWLPIKSDINVKNFYRDKDRNLAWCVIPKAGSSTLKVILMHVSQKFEDKQLKRFESAERLPYLHANVNSVFGLPADIKKAADPVKQLNAMLINESTFSFSFVRHPYTRIVSAYEDKALGLSENGEVFGGIRNKTFPKFINAVLQEWTSHSCNEHWRPYYAHCDYCDIKYDMIGRLETMEADLKYLAYMNNITFLLTNESSSYHVHPSGGHRYAPSKKLSDAEKDKKVIDYFSQLSATQLDNLYDMYRLDFEMFGYSVHPFVKSNNGL